MKVYLHTGAGKTGTSAIQVALAALRPQLAEAGILYPKGFAGTDDRSARGQISAGNGIALGWLINPATRRQESYDHAAALKWLDDCIAEAAGRDLLFSNESMQFAHRDETPLLYQRFHKAGYEIQIIHYVRHALDHAISSYLQNLKRGQIQIRGMQDLETFLRESATCHYMRSLQNLARDLAPGKVTVRLYDEDRSALVPNFLRLMSTQSFPEVPTAAVINRTPDPAEQVVFSTLAGMPDGPKLCRIAADLLLNRASSSRLTHRVPAEVVDAYAKRNQPVVDFVNNTYFDGVEKLKIKSDSIVIGDITRPAPEDVYRVFGDFFALMVAEPRRRGGGGGGSRKRPK